VIDPAAPLLWPGVTDSSESRQKIAGSTGVGVVVVVTVGVGLAAVLGVAEAVGPADALVVGLLDGGGDFLEDDEHPATARLTPIASANAAGRVSAQLGFTIPGYRAFVWRTPPPRACMKIDIRW
jgi:hypothetical protein